MRTLRSAWQVASRGRVGCGAVNQAREGADGVNVWRSLRDGGDWGVASGMFGE